MTDPLVGPRAKVTRAWEHLRQLEAEVGAFMASFEQGKTYDVVTEIQDEPRKEIRRLRVLTPIPAERWGVLVGDVVHNARSALEHLIEIATVVHYGSPLPRTEFPVFTDAVAFARTKRNGEPAPGSGVFAIRGVSPQVRTVVERLQPYQRGNDYANSPLWVLHELWNMDKHRLVPVVGISARADHALDPAFPLAIGPGKKIELMVMFPFEDGARLMAFELMPDQPETGVKMQMRLETRIQFGDGPVGGADVIGALGQCAKFVSAVVQNDFAPLFPAP